jgi:hypothetical protein
LLASGLGSTESVGGGGEGGQGGGGLSRLSLPPPLCIN